MIQEFCLVLVPSDSEDPVLAAERLLDADVPCACAELEDCLLCYGSDALSRVQAGYYDDFHLVGERPVRTLSEVEFDASYGAVVTPEGRWHDIFSPTTGRSLLASLPQSDCLAVVVELLGSDMTVAGPSGRLGDAGEPTG